MWTTIYGYQYIGILYIVQYYRIIYCKSWPPLLWPHPLQRVEGVSYGEERSEGWQSSLQALVVVGVFSNKNATYNVATLPNHNDPSAEGNAVMGCDGVGCCVPHCRRTTSDSTAPESPPPEGHVNKHNNIVCIDPMSFIHSHSQYVLLCSKQVALVGTIL